MATSSALMMTKTPFSSPNRSGSHLFAISSFSSSKPTSLFTSSSTTRKPIFFTSCFSKPTSRNPFLARITEYPSAATDPFDPEASLLRRRALLSALVSSVVCLACGTALAAAAAAAAPDSIRASGIGLKVATALRGSGWPDEAIVFALATLPVLELRGAIPVGYWMQLHPLQLTLLSILGNMVPVPIIVLYLKRFASFLSRKNATATSFLEHLFKRAREKAGPVEEFQWLGLMLFVAVPFPGTGAWTGAFIAAILDMPFWSAVTANFFGVVFAGLLVNLLVNLGIKYAVVVGLLLFFVSTIMWSVLRHLKKSLSSNLRLLIAGSLIVEQGTRAAESIQV